MDTVSRPMSYLDTLSALSEAMEVVGYLQRDGDGGPDFLSRVACLWRAIGIGS